MNRALGLAQSWISNEPQTEAAWFERIDLKPGEATILSGAFTRNGVRCIASHAEKLQGDGDVLLVHSLDGGRARTAEIHRSGQEIFSDSLSLAW